MFLRDLDVEGAMAILDQALAYKDRIVAVGLASAEVVIHPPNSQRRSHGATGGLFDSRPCRRGGPAEYICEAIDSLQISRIERAPALANRHKSYRCRLGRYRRYQNHGKRHRQDTEAM